MNSILNQLRFVCIAVILSSLAVVGGVAEDTLSSPSSPDHKSSIKLLCVGNSFSMNSTAFLPGLAKEGGKSVVILNCYNGGCGLSGHVAGIKAYEKDPESAAAKMYTHDGSFGESPALGKNFSLHEAIASDKWDFITIQQASIVSDDSKSYEPDAHDLVKYLRENSPGSEILVHETWAYREDDERFKNPDVFSQKTMYDRLKAAYAKVAATYHLRTIPVGDAFQTARGTPMWHWVPDTKFDYKNPPDNALPDQTGSLNVGWFRFYGQKDLRDDPHHANIAGQYLGSAVFYEVLFGDSVENVNYCPKGLTPEQAADLRRIAHEVAQIQAKSDAEMPPAPASDKDDSAAATTDPAN